MLIVGAYLWAGTAAVLRLGPRGAWLGFVGLYGNIAVLKLTFYYPVLTDATALVVGMGMTYAYLSDKRLLLALFGLIGAFSWPISLYIAAPLLVFPRSKAVAPATFQPLPWMLCAVPATAVVAATAYNYYVRNLQLPSFAAQPWPAVAPLALAMIFAYLTFGVRWLADRGLFSRLSRAYREASWLGVMLAAAMAAAVQLALYAWLRPTPINISAESFLKLSFLSGMAKPGVFIVAHAAFYGPIWLAAMMLWPAACDNLRRWGLGATLVALMGLIIGVSSESRHLMAFFPLLVAAVAPALEQIKPRRCHDALFVLVTLAASKFWLPINLRPFTGSFSEYPYQLFFINQGPWMSGPSYAIQCGVTLAMAALLGRYYLRRPPCLAATGLNNVASSAESVGKFWFGEVSKLVI